MWFERRADASAGTAEREVIGVQLKYRAPIYPNLNAGPGEADGFAALVTGVYCRHGNRHPRIVRTDNSSNADKASGPRRAKRPG